MTNFEFYKDDILKIANQGLGQPALKNGVLVPCETDSCECSECGFHGKEFLCFAPFMRWLYEKHVDKPKLTKGEKAFLELLDPNYYIARDTNGEIYGYKNKPQKNGTFWVDTTDNNYTVFEAFSVKFDFIKWKDAEPWKVEDLLKLEIME